MFLQCCWPSFTSECRTMRPRFPSFGGRSAPVRPIWFGSAFIPLSPGCAASRGLRRSPALFIFSSRARSPRASPGSGGGCRRNFWFPPMEQDDVPDIKKKDRHKEEQEKILHRHRIGDETECGCECKNAGTQHFRPRGAIRYTVLVFAG